MELIPKYSYLSILAISLLICAGLAVVLYRKRAFPGRAPFVTLVLTVAVLLVITILQLLSASEESILFWAQRAIIPGSFIAPLWCMFAIRFARTDRPLPLSLIVLLSIIPAVTSLSVILQTPPEAVYFRTWLVSTPIGLIMEYKAGPLFWVMTYYVYAVFFAGTAIFVRTSFRIHRAYLRQTITLTVAALIPFLTDFFFVFNIGGLPRVNLLPIAVSLSTLIITFTIGRLGVFHIVPIAHGLLFRNLTDGAVVIDFEGRVVDANQSALAVLGMRKHSAGALAIDELHAVPNVDLLLRSMDTVQEDVEIRSAEPMWASIAVVPLKDRNARMIGRLLTVRDITHRKRLQQEQESLLAELQEALNSVRSLEHLLPICANCKKIRDDKGYWTQVEAYVTEHTHARFSHGVCPECFSKLAPGEPFPEDTPSPE